MFFGFFFHFSVQIPECLSLMILDLDFIQYILLQTFCSMWGVIQILIGPKSENIAIA